MSKRILSNYNLLFSVTNYVLVPSYLLVGNIVNSIFQIEAFPITTGGTFPSDPFKCIISSVIIAKNSNDPVLINQVSDELSRYPENRILSWLMKLMFVRTPRELNSGSTIQVRTTKVDTDNCRNWIANGTLALSVQQVQTYFTTNKFLVSRISNSLELLVDKSAPQITSFFAPYFEDVFPAYECSGEESDNEEEPDLLDFNIDLDKDQLFPKFSISKTGKSITKDKQGMKRFTLTKGDGSVPQLAYYSQSSDYTIHENQSTASVLVSGLIAQSIKTSNNLVVLMCSKSATYLSDVEVISALSACFHNAQVVPRPADTNPTYSVKLQRAELDKQSVDNLVLPTGTPYAKGPDTDAKQVKQSEQVNSQSSGSKQSRPTKESQLGKPKLNPKPKRDVRASSFADDDLDIIASKIYNRLKRLI